MTRKSTRQMYAHTKGVDVTKKVLQERWVHLELKSTTLLHLQELMDTAGVAAAATVTEAVAQEKEKQAKFAAMGKEWGSEALRLISLEGLRPHLIDLLRFGLESLLAWHLISLPEGSLDGVVELTLAALFLLVSFVGVCLLCQFRSKRLTFNKRKKSS